MSTADIIARCEALYEDLDFTAARKWKEADPSRKVIAYMPVYVPREIIHAAGMLPLGIMGGGDGLEVIHGDAYYQSYICRIPRSTVELGLTGKLAALDGMLFPSICDVIRNLSGMWQILFKDKYVRYIDVPQNYDDEVGGKFYMEEMQVLREDLGKMAGKPITDEALNASIAVYNENRAAIRELYAYRAQKPWQAPTSELYLIQRAGMVLPPEEHTKLVREYIAATDAVPRAKRDNARLIHREAVVTLKAGDIIMVDGGMIQIKATEVTLKHVIGTVLTKGEMKSRRHINLPGVPVRLPPLTQKDYADLDLGVELGVDFFALSFAREPGHIQHLQLLLEQKLSKARVIAKIENQQALNNIDALVEASAGIMIARGDLGSECPIEDLPLIQRQIVERCSYHGRKVIVATQMLESMIENPVPTRAEVTDIFNAVIEQEDCVMLSGETSVGRYPTKCVEVLHNVISRIEQKYPSGRFASDAPLKTNKHKTVKAAIALANSIEGSKVLVFTLRGVMAHLLAHQRPEFAPIFAFTPKLHVSRTLVTARGVHPFVLEFTEGQPENSIRHALELLRREKLIKPGDPLVILSDALYDGINVDAILLREA